MSDTPLLPPCPAGDRRLRNPWSLALHLYRTDPVWRGAIDIVWIGTAVAVLTFGMPDLLPDWHRSPAPPQSAASAGSVPIPPPPPAPAQPPRGARSLNDYERYEMEHLLVWSGSPDAPRVAQLKEAWRAALERDGARARGMVEADANVGDPNAQYIMALVTVTSSGLPQRFTDAEPWLHKAADQGQPMAMEFLADNGLHGRGAHPVDKSTAFDLLRRSEELGYSEAASQLCGDDIEGIGVTADPAAAVPHCRRAAELGNGRAMSRLGYLYATGKGVAADPSETFKWFSKGAATGLPEAERNLAIAYLRGMGTAADPAKALEWMTRAADHGNVDAFISLGIYHRDGSGGSVDLPKAATWFRKAALKGKPEGQYHYAMALEYGRGVNPDKVEAYIYYNLAALQGHPGAEAALIRLKAQLSPEELERATRMADAMRTRKPVE